MSRVIVACPHCQARFDVSAFRPGSKIRCGACYKVFRIPERTGSVAAPEKPAAPRKPAAPVPRRRREAAGGRKRAVAPPPKRQTAPPPSRPAKSPPEKAPGKPDAVKPAPPKKPVRKPPPKKDPLLGHRLNDEFELLRKIGEGGYGSVYEATDLTLKRRVAVKLMLKEKTSRKEFVEKFLREARTAAQLSHPNIVKIHLVGFDKELAQHFLAMEFVEGQTVSDLMGKEGQLPIEKAVDIVVQSANGLAAAHRKNIMHRDIKPGNLILTPKGVVKIADFGLAKIYDPSDKASTVIGTPFFMPPEQFEGKARDGRTDIYSLGVTLYYMLTLKRPFDGTTPAQVLLNIIKTKPADPREFNTEIPEALWKIIRKMIARDLDDRYSSCEELLRDLRKLQEKDATEEKVFCPSCGYGNPLGAEKCAECSTSLLEPCPVCGNPDQIGVKFCGNCGANLVVERQVAEISDEAQSLVASGRLEKALERYREAQGLSPENSKVIEGLRLAEQVLKERDDLAASIGTALDEGRLTDALATAEKAAERFPGHGPLQDLVDRARKETRDQRVAADLAEARRLIEAREPGDACAAARRALEADPSHEEARELLARAESAVGEHAAARERASRLEREFRLAEALEAWRKALEFIPSDEGAEQAVTRIEGLLEQVERLRRRAEEALERRDHEAARGALSDALGIVPEDAGTLAILDRLRAEDRRLDERFCEALEMLVQSRYQQGANALEGLAGDFPGETRISSAREFTVTLMDAGDRFVGEGEALLSEGRLELASLFFRVAQRLSPLDDRIDRLIGSVKSAKRARLEALAKIRGRVDEGDLEGAIEDLAALGGISARDPDVAELARQVREKVREKQQKEREQEDEVLRAALRTARELLAADRVEAALAACQKALRIDRNSAEARELRSRIDLRIEKARLESVDSAIETGVVDLEKKEESSE